MSRKRKWKQPEVVVEEATGKQIRRLVVQGPPTPDSNDFDILIFCDDDTLIAIDLSVLFRFGVNYEVTVDGELETAKKHPKRLLEGWQRA
jgi:hypothetical protein